MKLKEKIRRWVLKLADGAPAEEYADFRKQSDDYISELLNEFSRINDRNQTLLNDRHRILKKMNDACKKTDKTADEMFREIGYERNDKLALKLEGCRSAKVCYYSERFRKAIAFNPTPTINNETEIYVQAYYVDDVEQFTEYVLGLWEDELDACSQLIREMEADNERSKT